MNCLRVLLFVAAWIPVVCLAQESRLIQFEITDQFNQVHTAADVRQRILLLVGSDKGGSQYQGAWTDRLRTTLENLDPDDAIRLIELADLRGVPFFVKGSVRKKFPRDKRLRVLLDWKGEFARAYRFESDNCNILLFNRSGHLVYRGAAQATNPDMLDEIVVAIETLLPAEAKP